MINLTKKEDCCGCGACVQKCPRACIVLSEDEEGFLYPSVRDTDCIDCGLCEKVCPVLNINESSLPKSVFAAKNLNDEERINSSSGGIFVKLAETVLSQNGVVFGAAFDSNWEVKHTYTDAVTGLNTLMKSKYVQSEIGNTFLLSEKFLKEGRLVLFVGTPCQIAGLKSFLQKDYANLLCVDCLCHGVPSPGVWRRYLNEWLIKKSHEQGTCELVVKDVDFRYKISSSWEQYCFRILLQELKKGEPERKIEHCEYHQNNLYMKGFLNNIYLRPSCYVCKFRNGKCHSDLSIGDYWGIKKLMPDFYDRSGVSLVLVNNDKGEKYFNLIDVEKKESSFADAASNNIVITSSVKRNKKREYFYSELQKKENTVDQIIERCIYEPFYAKLFNAIFRYGRAALRRLKLIK